MFSIYTVIFMINILKYIHISIGNINMIYITLHLNTEFARSLSQILIKSKFNLI